MADYYVDLSGNITENKKKKKKNSPDYYVDSNGNVTDRNGNPFKSESKNNTTSEKRTWFTEGAYGDGYQFGDFTKTVLGTAGDVAANVGSGILGVGEKIVDAGAYLIGGVGGVFGADKFQADTQKFIAKDLYDEQAVTEAILFGALGPDFNIDNYSVFGEKVDSVAQSGGQLLATAGLQAAGVPWWLTTGVTSFGSEVESAFNQGATYGEAGVSGLISAGLEVSLEKLTGGISFGGKTLTDGLQGYLTKGISNKVANTLVKYGFDMFGEGAEEFLTEIGNAIGRKLTYEDDKTWKQLLWSEEAFENYVEAFVGGLVMGGVANVRNAGRAIKTGRDYDTGLSVNEQKVVDKEVENRIAEKEKNGEKVDKKTRAQLEADVMEDLKKGFISIDTIESVMGGETYNSLQSLSKEMEEYSGLNKMKTMEMTGEQTDRLSELKEKNKKTSYESEIARLKEQLSKEVSDATMSGTDVYLKESYNEKGRRSQAFQADLSKYDAKQQATIQKAIDGGILNNTRRTHEFVDLIAKISADKGVSFDFSDNARLKESGFSIDGVTVNGFVQNGNITLNINSAKALNSVVGHEITHVLEGTEHYDALAEAVMQYAETKGELKSRKELIEKLYSGQTDTNIEQELVADLIGDYLFTDEAFVRQLSSQNRNIFQKIYDEIKYLVKTVTAGSKEAKQLEKVKKVFDKVYRDYSKAETKDSVQFSLAGKDENGIEIYETSEDTKKLSYAERKAKLLDSMKNEYAGRTAKFTKNGQIYYALYNDTGIKKGVHGDKKSSPKGYRAKINIGADGNYIELAENSIYQGTSVEQGKNNRFHSNAKTWDYYVKTIQSDGIYFDVLINVKDTGNSQYVYDITLNEADSLPDASSASYTGSSPASDISIPKTEENATKKQKSSLSDNDIAPTGNWNVQGKDIALEDIAPVAEGFAPAQQTQEEQILEEEEEKNLKESDERRIKSIQAKIQGFQVSRDVSEGEFDKSIAKKQEEYDLLKRKDTAKASKLLTQINDLKAKKENALEEIDRRIKNHRKAIESIENQSRARRRKSVQKVMRERMRVLMGDTSTWQDKKTGFGYQTQTFRRNLRDTVRDADGNKDIAKADAIYEELQGAYNHHEAELNREANRIKQEFRDMKITKEEDVYAQMLGEYRHNPECTLTPEVMQEYLKKNRDKIDTAKVDKIIERARRVYDSLYRRVNDVLRAQGMKEIGYREGYFPHFTEESQSWIARVFNWKVQNNNIPTDIAGLTEQFTPDRSWQSFNKRRTSDVTGYNFSKGLDTYVQGALDWIYHIEDIQKRRAFENEIRYQHSEKGVREQVDKVHNSPFYDADQMQEEIDRIYKNAKNPLNNFVQDLRKGTNVLAGKKDSSDRSMENRTNRQIYSVMTNLSSRVSANMVAGSVSSALTNFIPITQSWGQVSPLSSLTAMKETLFSIRKDDGMIAKSDFLTNRLRQSENLYKTGWDKASEKVGFLMEAVDSFTSQTVWRSKYTENLKRGMNEADAIKNADQFAENVMAGRSRGNMPTIFNEKNLVTRTLTAFQLEVANQYGYMFKDMPQDMRNESIGKLVKGYVTMFLGAYAYNALYSSLTGRDAAFDPIGIIEELLRDLGLFGEDDEEEPVDTVVNLVTNIVEEVPFVGGLIGGGRIPISSALPYDGFSVDSFTEMMSDVSEGDWKNIGMEWLNPVYYLLMPMGGGQLKKTIEGFSMFYDDLPIAGSYTNSGKLRFTVEDTPGNRIQAAVFGQYANENAREYFDGGRSPLNKKKIGELVDLDIPISEYWEIQDGLKGKEELSDKIDYIAGLDLPIAKKNILANNMTSRKEPIDLTGYENYEDFEEFDFATKNPGKYLISRAVGGYEKYKTYSSALGDIEANTDSNGKAVSGSRKEKVINYINGLNADYGEKIILFKSAYPSDDTYNYEIVEYLNSRDDLSYSDIETILIELGFTVEADGTVRW